MPTLETSSWLALKSRIESLVLSPVLPVHWPNDDFSPVLSGFLRVAWFPNITRRMFLKGSDPHRRLSLLRVDVFGKKNQDAAVALEIAGKVAAHFPADLRMKHGTVTARVTAAPQVAQAIPEDTHILVPVTIPIEVMA